MFYVKRNDGGGGGGGGDGDSDSNDNNNSVVKQKIHLHIIACTHTSTQANTLCSLIIVYDSRVLWIRDKVYGKPCAQLYRNGGGRAKILNKTERHTNKKLESPIERQPNDEGQQFACSLPAT